MTTRMTSRLAVVAALLLAAACGEKDLEHVIELERVVANRGYALNTSSRVRFRYRPPLFVFSMPDGWVELASTQLRRVNMVHGDVEAYVSVLEDGGSTVDNLNRWRRQMSLPPYTDEELRNLEVTSILRRRAVLVDLAGDYVDMSQVRHPEYGLIGLFVPFQEFAVAIKMTGPAAKVREARPAFLQFAASLQFNPEVMGGVDEAQAKAPFDPRTIQWDAPPRWAIGTGSPMRLVTFEVADKPGSQCWVIVLPGSAGGVAHNVNRWRGEMGQAPLPDVAIDELPRISVFSDEACFLEVEGEYRGMGTDPLGDALLLGVVAQVADHRIFIKMVGKRSDVESEKSNFIAFCKSLRVS